MSSSAARRLQTRAPQAPTAVPSPWTGSRARVREREIKRDAVIRAAVRKGIFHYKDEFVGFLDGCGAADRPRLFVTAAF